MLGQCRRRNDDGYLIKGIAGFQRTDVFDQGSVEDAMKGTGDDVKHLVNVD